jgi:phosphatidate cytidylyltransferase
MAFNWQTFRTRTLTAAIFVIVMLTGLLWNKWSFLVLFSIIHFGCWWEYLNLVEKVFKNKIDIVIKWFFVICGFTLTIVLGLQHIWFDIYIYPFSFKISVKLLIWILEVACLFIFITQNKQISTNAKRMIFAGFIYISLPFTLFLSLRDNVFYTNNEFYLLDLGKMYACGVIFSIWINDTMAYLVGSLIGKTPLSKISPKKTWEGTLSGSVLCVIVIAMLGYYIPIAKVISLQHWIAIAAICAIFGTIGDLLESKLKRMANVKDSGSLMPGHGGFLDRFDSLLLATPFVWLYVHFFIY